MRLRRTVGTILTVFLLAGCAGTQTPVQQTTTKEVAVSNAQAPGYTAAKNCRNGFGLYVQNQFSVAGVYGTLVRRSLDFVNTKAESVGLKGNEALRAVGWTNTKHVFYPDNPEGLRGEVWFRVLLPDGSWAWAPDVGVRAVETQHSPGDRDEDFDAKTQAALQPPGCELFPL